jgi:hypothetical protein
MRRTILLITLLLGVSAAKSSAVVDSMYANNQIAIAVDHPEYALGAPDKQQAQINSTGEIWLRFDYQNIPVDFEAGATLHLYWQRTKVDTIAAVLYLVHVNSNWVEGKSDSIMIIDQSGMITINVPKVGYNAIHLRLTGNPPAIGGANAFFIDAVSLIQNNLSVSPSGMRTPEFTMYPNPSLLQTGVNVQVPDEYVGHAQIVVYDVLGAQVNSISVDQAQTRLQMEAKGTYMARLIVDNMPVGQPFKFTIE